MNTNQHLDNLSEIRNIMERSTKFISLSGLSGISAGIIALIGSGVAYSIMNGNKQIENGKSVLIMNENTIGELSILALVILFLALTAGSIFTLKKAKKNENLIWNSTSKKLLINLLIPLITGGLFCIFLIKNGYYGLTAPSTLIFYGLATINASHYTLSEIRYLGICNIILGLINTFFIGYGLVFWALGFGVMHIVYGTIMYLKYDKKTS